MVLFNIRWSGVRWFFLIKVSGRGYGGCFYYKVDGGTVVLFNVRRLSGGKVVLFNGALSHVREIG